YAYKQLLIALKAKKIIPQGVDDNNIFGAGTTTATKQVQKAAGITVDGLAGAQTLKACRVLLAK
ncbi:MAG: peptidoglycan-binding domain-containing protein, partial [Clostridiaceae bacterium]|nr:peptidoglycan-binding domain-containing protein [Clostridiaceae bacterium]